MFHAAHNLTLVSELFHIADALEERGIDLIVLKGLPLSKRLFGRIDRRPLADNDLLVHVADVPRARKTLRELGYRNAYPIVRPGRGRDNQ
jgi:putative nucleotidyltransferase-like protein